jgi:hypothetical protein
MRALRIHPLEARSRIVEIPLTQIAGFVEQDSRMVDDLAVARPEFDGLDVLELVDRHRQDEVAEQILAFSRDGERLAHGQDEVGLAQLPAVRKARLCRTVARVALDGSLVDPIPERVDVVRVEPPLPFEMPELAVASGGMSDSRWSSRSASPLLDVVNSSAVRTDLTRRADGRGAVLKMMGAMSLLKVRTPQQLLLARRRREDTKRLRRKLTTC